MKYEFFSINIFVHQFIQSSVLWSLHLLSPTVEILRYSCSFMLMNKGFESLSNHCHNFLKKSWVAIETARLLAPISSLLLINQYYNIRGRSISLLLLFHIIREEFHFPFSFIYLLKRFKIDFVIFDFQARQWIARSRITEMRWRGEHFAFSFYSVPMLIQ